jgi:formate/nitrite transporter FocA (FNT family)
MARDNDDDLEDLKAADAKDVHRAVQEEGEAELRRPAGSLFWSGLAAGLAVNASLITEGALRLHLPESEWRDLVVGLGYPIGFLLVVLGRMQFFTESTLTAMIPLVARPSAWSARRTARLWGIVLFANLLGTAIGSGAVASDWLGHATLSEEMLEISRDILPLGPLATFVNAIPAGFLIAVLAWSLPNARDQAFLVIFAVTYVVGIAGFSHSIVGSDEAFLLVWEGVVPLPEALARLVAPAVLGNLVGGAGLFAVLAHAQVRQEVAEVEWRKREAEADEAQAKSERD